MRQGTRPLRAGSKLDRESILEAAFEVLDAQGFDGLSLRMVAERLKVQTPALYWHIENKASLINLMAATFSRAANRDKDHARGWRNKLLAFARALRRAMLAHRDSARLSLAASPVEDPKVAAERIVAPLVEAGLSARQALSYCASVIAYTVGWVAYEQSQSMHEFLAQMIDFSESFDTGLRALVGGLTDPSATSPTTSKSGSVRPIR